ncbi:MAG TPA: AEC family transporter [Ramlibacter sp.]|nr:AEC family transporter [Ramlibacter sp.]
MNFAQLLFPDFSLILAGFLVCRFTPLGRNVWEPVESLVYYLLFPVLLFQSIVKSPLDVREASSLMAAGLALSACGMLMAYSLPHLPLLGRSIAKRDHAGAAQIAFRFNSFIALAIASRLAGDRGSQLIAVLIGVCVPFINVGAVWPMARHGQGGMVKALLTNPLIIATISGLAFNMAGLHVLVWLEPTLTRIGAASIALGLMTAGAGLQFGSLAVNKTLTVGLLAIRHFMMPLAAFVLARVFRLDDVQTAILLAFSAMPTASSAYVLAVRMGYNGPYVAGLVTLSTILGLASLPFALGVLR